MFLTTLGMKLTRAGWNFPRLYLEQIFLVFAVWWLSTDWQKLSLSSSSCTSKEIEYVTRQLTVCLAGSFLRDDVNRKWPENFGFWLKFSEPLSQGISASTSTESANFRRSVPKRNSVVWFQSYIAVVFQLFSWFRTPPPLYFWQNAKLQRWFSTEVIHYCCQSVVRCFSFDR